MIPADSHLPDALLERVLAGLGLSQCPDATLDALRTIYAAWCQRVPFDNVRKLIHVRTGNADPLPGNTAEDYFESWLRFGTGGTCWSGAGACCTLLKSLGFEAVRGVGTMFVAPDAPPNHGTVFVTFEGTRFLVDCGMLHGEPLRLEADADTSVEHPAWGVRCLRREGAWRISWRPLHKLDGFECRLEETTAGREDFERFYEITRAWSPFNYELCVRRNRGKDVIGASFGHAVSLRGDGSVVRGALSAEERVRLLIEEIGMSEEIVSQLPADVPTPPPPWSRTAARALSQRDEIAH